MGEVRAFSFVDSEPGLTAMVDSLLNERTLALDTESDPFHRYFEKVCLIQISSPTRDFVYDPLALGLPSALAAVLADPGRTLVLHGADYDVRSLRRSFDVVLGRVFDTWVAAQLLGWPELGLKALLFRELGVHIEKAEQRSDWGRRPLSEAQLRYARADTMHLLELGARMGDALQVKGRLGWMQEECAGLRTREANAKTFDPEDWRRVKGVQRLGPAGQRAARAIFVWRDAAAQAEDRPPFRVLGNEQLVQLAAHVERHGAGDPKGLKSLPFVPKSFSASGLHAAIVSALTAEPEQAMGMTAGKGGMERRDEPETRKRIERLRAARAQWARDLEMDPGFLISTAMLERLAREPPRNLDDIRRVRGMTEWRVEALGPVILAALLL